MKRAPPSLLALGAAVVLCAACGCAAYGTLSAVARPGQMSDHLTRIDRALHRITMAQQELGDPSAYLPHAVCTGRLDEAPAMLRSRLEQDASRAGLAAPLINLTPPDAMETAGRLTPILFELDGAGRYEAVVELLHRLAAEQPQIFADTLDLTSDSGKVTLKFTGRILCAPSAT